MTAPEIFSSIRLIEALPDYFHYPKGGEELLRSMRGATILAIGGTDADGIEGGGLLIDYIKAGDMQKRRVVFEFNELGLWPKWEGPLPMKALLEQDGEK